MAKKETMFRFKSDFFKHRTVKTNDKIQRFGVVITPLSRKNISDNANYSI